MATADEHFATHFAVLSDEDLDYLLSNRHSKQTKSVIAYTVLSKFCRTMQFPGKQVWRPWKNWTGKHSQRLFFYKITVIWMGEWCHVFIIQKWTIVLLRPRPGNSFLRLKRLLPAILVPWTPCIIRTGNQTPCLPNSYINVHSSLRPIVKFPCKNNFKICFLILFVIYYQNCTR